MRSLRAMGWLLRYPDADLVSALAEIEAEIDAEPAFGPDTRAGLAALLAELRRESLLELEERYVVLFDRTRGLSLHLHEHVHGEARERGGAMVQLQQIYERAGLELMPGELPDFVPVICEFLSLRPPAEASAVLADASGVLRRIQARLEQRGSAYAAALGALLELAGAAEMRAGERDPDPAAGQLPDLEALDAAWEDAPVIFGPGAGPAACASGAPVGPLPDPRARDDDPGRRSAGRG